MFTGIIKTIGEVRAVRKSGSGMELKIIIPLPAKVLDIKVSDSLSVNGVCLTVKSITRNRTDRAVPTGRQEAAFDVVSETLKRSNLGELKAGAKVNLEPAIRAGEPFGGHFVQGHIDGTGIIRRKVKSGNEYLLEVSAPPKLTELMMEKGSIALEGISLTLVGVHQDRFSVALIPFTLAHTNLKDKTVGSRLNIEVDVLGKWMRKILSQSANPAIQQSRSNPLDHKTLEELL